ncbi:MAG: class I SAM-dependent methyltransferase [candidate division WOR-3 bacterium]|nr:MAG: class I SAM-dependent methyltransferase [candidate division WOR-3 bacterium]
MKYRSSYERSAYLYDLFDKKPNIGFFLRCASGIKEILDIGAGTGRIALPLAEKGCRVFCVEPSPAMRREFRKKLRKQKDIADRIILNAGEARSFRFDRTFGFALMSGVFDHFLDDGYRLAALRNISRHLEPGGRFIFDLAGARPKVHQNSVAGERRSVKRSIRRFVSTQSYGKDRYRVTILYEVHDSGKMRKRVEEMGLVGFVSQRGIRIMLHEAGFQIVHEYGGYDSSDYAEGGNVLIIEALKKPDLREAH